MVRTFLHGFEKLLNGFQTEAKRLEAVGLARQYFRNSRTHPDARVPVTARAETTLPIERSRGKKLYGTILTGEMFAPILAEQIARYNALSGARLTVLAVPNTYFGGDVSVAGLLCGKDYLNVKDKIAGDFVIIPKHTIKSDEPILLDGMTFDELRSRFNVPVYADDMPAFFARLGSGK